MIHCLAPTKNTKLLVLERIKDNTDVRIINCISCSIKKSKLIEGKIIITSPATSLNELKTSAHRLGIENFMDSTSLSYYTYGISI